MEPRSKSPASRWAPSISAAS